MSAFTEVPCPACRATAGQPCHDRGRVLADTHKAREDAHRDVWLIEQGYEPLLRRNA